LTPAEEQALFEGVIDDLFQLAGGLYWPLEQALHTDINYLLIAYKGHCVELGRLFGAEEEEVKTVEQTSSVPVDARGQELVLTPAIFDVEFAPDEAERVIRQKA